MCVCRAAVAVVSAQALPVTDGVCATVLHFGRVPVQLPDADHNPSTNRPHRELSQGCN